MKNYQINIHKNKVTLYIKSNAEKPEMTGLLKTWFNQARNSGGYPTIAEYFDSRGYSAIPTNDEEKEEYHIINLPDCRL